VKLGACPRLLLIGRIAEQLWGARRWLVIYFVGALLGEVAALEWQPIGAGNSVGTFSLAASACVAGLRPGNARRTIVAASVGAGALGALLLLRDIHGAAAAGGSLVALALIALERFGKRRR